MIIMTRINRKIAIRSLVIIISLIAVLCLISDQSYAEQETSTATAQKKDSQETDSEQIERRLREIGELLKVAEAAENEQSASQLGTTLAGLKERNDLLRNLSAVYMRLLTSLEKQTSFKKEAESLGQAAESEKVSLISESPPFSLTVYDRYLDRLNKAAQDKESAIAVSAFYKRHVGDALKEVDRTNKQHRLLKEEVDSYGANEVPLPLQCGQVCCTEKKPCCMRTWPCPPQVVQVEGVLPFFAPLPSHSSHFTWVGMRIFTSVPATASSSDSSRL